MSDAVLKNAVNANQPLEVDAATLKTALRHLPGGVSIITAGEGDDVSGATVTSATALSVDPPRMLVSLNRTSSTFPVVQRYQHFSVNIPTADQKFLADQFAGIGGLKGKARYEGGTWRVAESGALTLDGAVAVIDCELEEVIERHSHAILIGRVVAIRVEGGEALAYVHGRYSTLPA